MYALRSQAGWTYEKIGLAFDISTPRVYGVLNGRDWAEDFHHYDEKQKAKD